MLPSPYHHPEVAHLNDEGGAMLQQADGLLQLVRLALQVVRLMLHAVRLVLQSLRSMQPVVQVVLMLL
jgi:hypothetical protein